MDDIEIFLEWLVAMGWDIALTIIALCGAIAAVLWTFKYALSVFHG